ncbi:hypothetical protein KIPB_012968, partial [Kipferlia bialata]|eukprot:g12968.t1
MDSVDPIDREEVRQSESGREREVDPYAGYRVLSEGEATNQ